MEPQIIDYYNETPHGINIIDKLNEEYSELQSKNNRYVAPIHIAKTFDECLKYDKILNEEFPEKIREILKDEEYGLLSIYNLDPFPFDIYSRLMHNSWIYICSNYDNSEKECFKDKIVNKLDNITKNKNRKWCEDRINLAFEICLSKYDTINDENSEEIIDDLIHHILNDEGNDHLPDFYIETIDFYTNEKYDIILNYPSLHSLNLYHCEKCEILCNHVDTEETSLLCIDCNYI